MRDACFSRVRLIWMSPVESARNRGDINGVRSSSKTASCVNTASGSNHILLSPPPRCRGIIVNHSTWGVPRVDVWKRRLNQCRGRTFDEHSCGRGTAAREARERSQNLLSAPSIGILRWKMYTVNKLRRPGRTVEMRRSKKRRIMFGAGKTGQK